MERRSLYRGLGALYTDDRLAGLAHQTAYNLRLWTRQFSCFGSNSSKIYEIYSLQKLILATVFS